MTRLQARPASRFGLQLYDLLASVIRNLLPKERAALTSGVKRLCFLEHRLRRGVMRSAIWSFDNVRPLR
jgi:hypothetical protein